MDRREGIDGGWVEGGEGLWGEGDIDNCGLFMIVNEMSSIELKRIILNLNIKLRWLCFKLDVESLKFWSGNLKFLFYFTELKCHISTSNLKHNHLNSIFKFNIMRKKFIKEINWILCYFYIWYFVLSNCRL